MPKFRFVNFLTARIFHLLRDRKANVAIMFAITMVPCIYLLGMALDYTQALRKQSQLDAATDAAAIAAIRPAMLTKPNSVAQATALAVFSATANNLPGLTSIPAPTITITDAGLGRTITVSYNAKSINNFPILLGSPAWPIRGSSTAKASSAPNLNFYLVLDNSPSMAIGATQNDINNLISATAHQPSPSANCDSPAMKRIPTSTAVQALQASTTSPSRATTQSHCVSISWSVPSTSCWSIGRRARNRFRAASCSVCRL